MTAGLQYGKEEPTPGPRGDVDDLIFGSEDPGPSQR